MDLHELELEVMLKNIIENGEFDFVILDTGNNTRDSSILALEYSDYVLMVLTQDVTTVDSNISFISASEIMELDLSKVRLVINNLMPTSATGISISHIEEAFPFECIARIKRDEAVVKANNWATPLVYKPARPFTRQISSIVNYLAAGNEYKPVLAKQDNGFFSKLFKG